MMNETKQLSAHRFVAIGMLFVAVVLLFVVQLVRMQLTDYDGTYSFSRLAAAEKVVTVKAARGNICDRNGKILVSTEEQYTMVANEHLPTDNATRNETIRTVLTVLNSCGASYSDKGTFLPYTYENGKLTRGAMGSKAQTYFDAFAKAQKWDVSAMDDAQLFSELCRYYGLTDETTDVAAADWNLLYRIVQIRYDIGACEAAKGIYTFLEKCDVNLVNAIKERALAGIGFDTGMIRVYHYPGTLSHVLGRTGKIQSDDADYYSELGYAMDAIVGVDGIEKLYETTLRGTDGKMTVTEDKDGNVLVSHMEKEAVAGRNVYLTIDIDLQIKAEQALKANIEKIAAEGAATADLYDGEDAKAGAICAVVPSTGEVLVMASYPTFNLVTFSDDYKTLSQDATHPFLNRAVQGQYAPGSTFKPGVAAAALENGIINGDTIIRDLGVYKYFEDFQPHCWIYDRHPGATHGDENVVDAICDSCNYFFYETGRNMGIDKMNTYMTGLGLGQPTGIELEEKTGTLAGPAEREAQNIRWNPGDVLQAAIGQSDNLFTPLQMAMYLSALVNGGKRQEAHLYLKTTEFYTEAVKDSYQVKTANTVPLSAANFDLIKQGMARASAGVFSDAAYAAGCKTGTAQVSKTASDNALFEAFAPLDSPEIAAYAVIENGSSGSSVGQCVRELFDAYFAAKP